MRYPPHRTTGTGQQEYSTKKAGIQATSGRLSEYPKMLYSKDIYTIYFCTFDINTTVSTWLVRMELMSLELSVLGNISTAFFALSIGGNITITSA